MELVRLGPFYLQETGQRHGMKATYTKKKGA
jgi:hypothetical protein